MSKFILGMVSLKAVISIFWFLYVFPNTSICRHLVLVNISPTFSLGAMDLDKLVHVDSSYLPR